MGNFLAKRRTQFLFIVFVSVAFLIVTLFLPVPIRYYSDPLVTRFLSPTDGERISMERVHFTLFVNPKSSAFDTPAISESLKIIVSQDDKSVVIYDFKDLDYTGYYTKEFYFDFTWKGEITLRLEAQFRFINVYNDVETRIYTDTITIDLTSDI